MKAQIQSCHELWTWPEETPLWIKHTNVRAEWSLTSVLPHGSKVETPICILCVPYHHLQGCPQKLGLNFLCASETKSVSFCFDAKMSVTRCTGWSPSANSVDLPAGSRSNSQQWPGFPAQWEKERSKNM